MTTEGKPVSGGLGEKAFDTSEDRDLGGTGGSAGGGTRSGRGEPAGGEADADERGAIGTDMSDATDTTAALGQLAGRTDSEEAAEAAALGSDDGALADAAGDATPAGHALGEAVGSSAGRADVGSGTGGDRGELGGGDSTPSR